MQKVQLLQLREALITLVEVSWKFYMLHQCVQAILFTFFTNVNRSLSLSKSLGPFTCCFDEKSQLLRFLSKIFHCLPLSEKHVPFVCCMDENLQNVQLLQQTKTLNTLVERTWIFLASASIQPGNCFLY